MILKVILVIFLIGFIYRALARFILPVFHMTKAASDHMKRMQDQMNGMNNPSANTNPFNNNINNTQKQKPRHIDEDYIDYEEVK